MAEETTETAPQKQKSKSRAFYYIDGILIRLLLLVVVVALLWNWDGFWKTDIKVLKQAQETYFPIKYKAERMKVSVMNENKEIMKQMKNKISEYQQDTDNALKAVETAKEKAKTLLRYYDTSRRIIDKLKRKFSPDDLEAALICNSVECENIVNSSPEADPKNYVFQ
jgi:DNA mismatch repair ATPase MutL